MREILTGIGVILAYYFVLASAAFALRRSIRAENELFRKTLHCILLGSLLVWVYAFSVWWHAALTAVVFAAAIYPILCIAERVEGYSAFVTERKRGELKASLLVVFFMFAVIICVCWGWLNDRLLVLAGVYAWGFGDAAAAVVGKRFGKHALTGKHIEGRKSVEGSVAMFVTSLICVGVILLFRGGLVWYGYLLIPIITAAVATIVELFSLGGMDTITCPLAATAVLLPLVDICQGIV